jgi:hypothetical protein
MNAASCAHKDCERTDANPVEVHLLSRERELLHTCTYHFCPDHERQLLDIEVSETLPPAEWFAPDYMPDVRYPPQDG